MCLQCSRPRPQSSLTQSSDSFYGGSRSRSSIQTAPSAIQNVIQFFLRALVLLQSKAPEENLDTVTQGLEDMDIAHSEAMVRIGKYGVFGLVLYLQFLDSNSMRENILWIHIPLMISCVTDNSRLTSKIPGL